MMLRISHFALVVVLRLGVCFPGVDSSPIRTTFDGCRNGIGLGETYDCCPPQPKRPIVNFKPVYDPTKPLRVRKSLHCLENEELAVYKAKLDRAYKLMRDLPSDDPRSLEQQRRIHCAYGSGSFTNCAYGSSSGNICADRGTDIHFGWLFHPWHRLFVYFHERILQSLIGDPSFTLHFWNWDNDGSPTTRRKGCVKAGNTFPVLYADPSLSLFSPRRSIRARNPPLIVDLGMWFPDLINYHELPEPAKLARNTKVMHETMIVQSTTSSIFYGRDYRAGDDQGSPWFGAGSLEITSHTSVHFWVGFDVSAVPTSAGDPIFYAHHGNVDRLWDLWHHLGPNRTDPIEQDFLDAEFLFYDENADLIRVKVGDSLDFRALGYQYEEVNDWAWNDNQGRLEF